MNAPIWALAFAAVAGLWLGESTWRGAVESRASKAPKGLELEQTVVPYRQARLAGELGFTPEAWALDFHRGLKLPAATRPGPAELSGVVRLPEEGQIAFWAADASGADPRGGVGVILERVGAPSTTVVAVDGGTRRRLPCSDELPIPSDLPIAVRVAPTRNGISVRVGDSHTTCDAVVGHHGPAIRPGLRRVWVSDMRISGVIPDAPGPGLRPLWWLAGSLIVAGLVFTELWMGAWAPLVVLTTLPLVLGPAMGLMDFRLWAETARATWLPVPYLPVVLPVLLTTMPKVAHFLGRQLRERWGPGPMGHRDRGRRDWPVAAVIAAGLPLILIYAGTPGELGYAPAAGFGLVVAAVSAYGVPAALAALGSDLPRRSATWVLVAAVMAAIAVSTTSPLHRDASLWAALFGAAIGLLVWANANAGRVRFYNPTCLAAVLLATVAAESTLRETPAGVAWSDQGARVQADDEYGWIGRANEDFARMDAGRHTAYPDKGYPVAIPGPDGRRRIVALGGSTTGGAWQNDNLREFYPARLDEDLRGEFQVINQGVGGWTTWHIRRYLSDHLDALAPDIVTLYVGHNDVLTPVALPYAELYAGWQSRGIQRSVSDALGQLRLYQALKYTLLATRPPGRRVAVPIDDAEENLRAVVDMVTARGGRVILASEGISPDPSPLMAYNAMLEGLADSHPQVDFIDVADILHQHMGLQPFLDDCHLTPAGHKLVAQALVREIRAAGANGAPR